MFPEQVTQTDPDDLLRCKDSRSHSDQKLQDRDQNSPGDMDLASNVDNALWQSPLLRALDYNDIEVRVRKGMVGLYGHVVTETNRLQAEKAIRNVKGIRGIANRLIADDRLLSEVATALSAIEHTYDCQFFTGVSHGVVLLSGTVDDARIRSLAEQYAARNAHVRGVVNNVRVRDGGAGLPDPPLLQPYIGAEFHFLDGVSGTVEHVIIDPDNRRVAALTLRGRFADPHQEPEPLDSSGARQQERTLVLSITTVRYITRTSGFLKIHSQQSDQYSDFNSADFLKPPADWKPPYPYCPADVLFQAKAEDATIQIPEHIESPIEVALAHEVLKDQLLENDSLGG